MSQGIEEARLKADGVGEGCPVAESTTPGGRERNRRVEFFVIE
jgi:outer membrane protein OmpA-like peptidoglycan-associated protein